MKIKECDGGAVVTLTKEERAALYTVMAHTVPLKIVESAQTTCETVNPHQVQSVVLALFMGLKP